MKKIIIPLTFVLLICTTPFFGNQTIAVAEIQSNEYLRIITEDTPFYQRETDNSPLFYLPYTYYVKVLDVGVNLTHVECAGKNGLASLDGYVPTDMLYDDNLSVLSPYPTIKIITADNAVLYKDSNTLSALQYVFSGREMDYYGSIKSPSGENLYYVSYNDKLGYVKESAVYPFIINNHPNELTFIPVFEEPDPVIPPIENDEGDNLDSLRIALYATLGVAGVIALVFVLKGKRQPTVAVSFDEENDYE